MQRPRPTLFCIVADLPPRAILDEVQRVPSLFTALKVAVDRDRSPGRFLLTGSANVLLERGGRQVVGIEIKAAATVTGADFRCLRKLAVAAGRRFAAGAVLYDGETSARFGEGLHAVPIRALWEAG